jgi:hypothetical protein
MNPEELEDRAEKLGREITSLITDEKIGQLRDLVLEAFEAGREFERSETARVMAGPESAVWKAMEAGYRRGGPEGDWPPAGKHRRQGDGHRHA